MSTAEGFEELVAVVEHRSLTAAAEALGLPRPTLSRRLSRLEERLGVRLVHRTTRRITVTPPGEALYAKARLIVEAAREAEAEARRSDDVPRGLLRVSVPAGVPQTVMAGWISGFLERHPEVQIELVATSEHVDLVGGGFDVVMRAGAADDSTLIAHTLVQNNEIAVASPGYLARRGTPETPGDLAHHDCILAYREGIAPQTHWPLRDGGTVAVRGRLGTNLMEMRLHAAVRGHGIAAVYENMAAEDLADGRLVRVLPEHIGKIERVCLMYRERAFVEPKVRAFIDHLSAEIEAHRAARQG